MSLSYNESNAIQITERVCSVFSLVGAAFIITTFLLDNAFHKPINRLVFYAAWGNVLANIATLIGVSGIHIGGGGALCQFQAFLIQWWVLQAQQYTLQNKSDRKPGSCPLMLYGLLQWLAMST